MGERSDIIRTMHREMREHAPERVPSDYAIYNPAQGAILTGQIVARGLSDEHADRHYAIVDAIDGRSHYVDLGSAATGLTVGNIVRISPPAAGVRQVDHTIAEVAAGNDGRYNIDAHLRHDPSASEAFAQAHVRRLEAIRRASGAVEREPDGSWNIAPDHLDRVATYERQRVSHSPVITETLTSRPLEQMVAHDGATWLDDTLTAAQPLELERGFGRKLRQALVRRQQWLVEQQLAETEGDRVRFKTNLVAALRERELRRAAVVLSEELGLAYVPAKPGTSVAGICRRSVTVGDSKYALIEKSREFTLVPWRPALDRALGKQVSGIVRGNGISWSIGRGRDGPTIGSF